MGCVGVGDDGESTRAALPTATTRERVELRTATIAPVPITASNAITKNELAPNAPYSGPDASTHSPVPNPITKAE